MLGELLAGFACGEREARNREELRQFLDCRRVVIPAVDMETADAYALLYRTLRRKGRSIPANDLWIAASCLEHGAVLFSLDVHFDQVDGQTEGTTSLVVGVGGGSPLSLRGPAAPPRTAEQP